jgi:fatty acid desaturase
VSPKAIEIEIDDDVESPLTRLSDEQIEAIGKEFDELHDQVFEDLGDRDAKYILGIIDLHRRLALLGRVMLVASRYRPMWLAGTATLSLAKILENMEIGHNVMHGQWDWMNHPVINSSSWDTYTNIRGLDRDLGYEIMRIDPHQKWHPVYLFQPIYNLVLAAFFEWGVAVHDLNFEAIKSGDKSKAKVRRELKGMAGKARTQITKDYIAFPVLSGLINTGIDFALAAAGVERTPVQPRKLSRREKARVKATSALAKARRNTPAQKYGLIGQLIERKSFRQPFKSTLSADFVSNIVRNVWAYAIIFCGHFPDQTYTFSQDETEDETRGQRHVRQLLGAANIEGGPLFHVISGNLGYQVEHHLYPDMPSTRYGEIAPRVREICERYELPYNTGPFSKQLGGVQRTILRLAFPGGKPRPKPGPYKGDKIKGKGESTEMMEAAA